IAVGSRGLFDYAADDAGLRNIATVTLPALGFTNRLVASLLGITEEYVCMAGPGQAGRVRGADPAPWPAERLDSCRPGPGPGLAGGGGQGHHDRGPPERAPHPQR